ncbi:Protein FAR1-RELATED SEQUENCE 5 [Hordeum vulgare]|nr:Protein FAR1-RELATED SEQUENCE 5 [Hordeum vulgare]
MSYKAWKRGAQYDVNEEEIAQEMPEFEGDSAVSEFWEEENKDDSEEEVLLPEARPRKLNLVRNPRPTSIAHNEAEIPKFEDFVPDEDEVCFLGDVDISDSDEDVPVLPSGRKRRLKKKKEMTLYDPLLPDAHEQLCKDLCFTNVLEFRKALRNYHVRTLRNFQYHRNEPKRVIVWCPDRNNGCEFFLSASKVAHEDTFTIKK